MLCLVSLLWSVFVDLFFEYSYVFRFLFGSLDIFRRVWKRGGDVFNGKIL